jgi:hypothetical protein
MEVIVLAGSDRAYTVLTDGSLEDSADWSYGSLVDEGGDPLVTEAGDELTVGILPTELAFPTSPDETIVADDKVTMLQAFNRLYVLREANSNLVGWREQALTTGGIVVVGTVATLHCAAHGYTAGMRVRVEGGAAAAFDGHEYDVATAAPDSFTVAVPSGTAGDGTAAGVRIRRVKPPLYWDGNPANNFVRSAAGVPDVGPTYRHLRSVGWAAYINGRLIAPDGRDRVMLSDIYDPDTFDPYWQSFRANAGSNDYIVGVHPCVDGSVLVFGRKSIWLATISQSASADGSSFDVATGISSLSLLTDEVGCCARRSIQTAGAFVYFLSDSGVYRLDTQMDLKLRGNTRPLSDPIDDQMKELSADLADRAVGLWFNNRYYLAAPLQGSEFNNAVFVYNALNEAWETRDIYNFGADNLLVATYVDERRLFVSSRSGKLFLLDELEAGDEPNAAVDDYVDVVPGRMVTRRYSMGTLNSKRFLRVLADVTLPAGGELSISANVANPDRTIALATLENTSAAEEDYTLKAGVRAKGHYAELEIVTSGMRPEITTVSLEAAMSSQAPQDARSAA